MVVRGEKKHPLKGVSHRGFIFVGRLLIVLASREEDEGAIASTFDRHRQPANHVIRGITTAECPCQPIKPLTGVPSKLSHLGGVMRPHNAIAKKNTRLPNSSAVD
ncbi:unnamed protein product [Eruca vesicaria subsp. sativa]|uniref:Uncharacterized protein n=1 Tax=Eruca vesicaria subsp. sativa TaxID=29727 RepID=A0ABC8LFM4_ERUVS|nr:unnamed protein product [Eruca vesicaria subsp. sativa]